MSGGDEAGRVESIFHAVRALSGLDREACLDKSCGDDADLRQRVEALLRANERAGAFLQTASVAEGDPPLPEPGPAFEEPGTTIAQYRLVEELGTGGFGVVFLADQMEPIKRRVALKVVKAGMDTRQVLSRFAAERRALALMDHPHIARVLDAGATERGRPYFVMELVQGGPITEYADENNLGIRERLELFRGVCAAVQHAHQKGVIHRDLKPSNILVTTVDGVPIPKVIDFGIAKAIADSPAELTAFTREGQFVGTPQYMSPEQAETTAEGIDTRTDVYSLGVVLYELLIGTTPIDPDVLRTADASRIRKLIVDSETPRPSTRLGNLPSVNDVTEHRQLDRRTLRLLLRDDLDWIVLRALAKDRSRRYDTVSELSADIRRYLAGEPITARPPSAGYRLRTFVRRHKVAVTAGAVITGVLLLGIVGTTTALLWALSQRAELAETNTTLDEVVRFQASQLSAIDPSRMGVGLRDGLLTRSRMAMQSTGRAPDDVATDLARLDELLAGTDFTTLARESLQSNIFEPALQAIDADFEDRPVVQAQLLHTIAKALTSLGIHTRAEELERRALTLREQELGPDDPQTLESTGALGLILRQQSRLDEAAPYYEAALEGWERVAGRDNPLTLDAYNNRGAMRLSQARFDEAERDFLVAADGFQRIHGDEHEQTIRARTNLASLYQTQQRFDKAEPLLRTTLGSFDRILGPGHIDTLAASYNLGLVLQLMGRAAEAEDHLKAALDGFRRELGSEHPRTISALNGYAVLLDSEGRAEEAADTVAEALAASRRVNGNRHLDTIASIANTAILLRKAGRPDEAEPLGAESVATAREVLPAGHWFLGGLLNEHARTLGALERFEEAIAAAEEARVIFVGQFGEGHAQTLDVTSVLRDLEDLWDQAVPDEGHDAARDGWQEKLDTFGGAAE